MLHHTEVKQRGLLVKEKGTHVTANDNNRSTLLAALGLTNFFQERGWSHETVVVVAKLFPWVCWAA